MNKDKTFSNLGLEEMQCKLLELEGLFDVEVTQEEPNVRCVCILFAELTKILGQITKLLISIELNRITHAGVFLEEYQWMN
jgi:hypothetical protein